jgi:tetratricopeptide (TPR) repeat protein
MNIFTGRAAEQALFQEWVAAERPNAPRVALAIGHPGSGKSALLARFEELARAHVPERWFTQRVELNASESASQFLERLLREAFQLLRRKFLSKGPRDASLLESLLKMVPTVGDLLAQLVEEDKRPGWLRFIEYCEALSAALERNDERLILLIDPDRELDPEQPEDWLSVAKRLPPRLRIVIAQRPTDPLASHAEARLFFAYIPGDGLLADLDERAVSDWYQQEMQRGRLSQVAVPWPDEVRDEIAGTAYARMGGFAFAHDSAIRLLMAEQPFSPHERVASLTSDVEKLLDAQFNSLARQGGDRLGAALALQIYTLPVPAEVWARAAGVKVEKLLGELADPRYATFFRREDGEGHYAPFHALFAERLEKELERIPGRALELAEAAWGALEPALRRVAPDRLLAKPFELLAATAVAARFNDLERMKTAVSLTADAKRRLNLLDAYEADLRLVLGRAGQDAITLATYLNALGAVHEDRGDLSGAEGCYENAWAIGGADVELPASPTLEVDRRIKELRKQADVACRALASLYRNSGRAEQAEAMSRRALGYAGGSATLNDTIRRLGEQGVALARERDWKGAERALRSALAMSRQFGGAAADYEITCINLAVVYIETDDLTGAERVLHEALRSAQQRRSRETEANVLYQMGVVCSRNGDHAGERANWESALRIYKELGRGNDIDRMESLLRGEAETHDPPMDKGS